MNPPPLDDVQLSNLLLKFVYMNLEHQSVMSYSGALPPKRNP